MENGTDIQVADSLRDIATGLAPLAVAVAIVVAWAIFGDELGRRGSNAHGNDD